MRSSPAKEKEMGAKNVLLGIEQCVTIEELVAMCQAYDSSRGLCEGIFFPLAKRQSGHTMHRYAVTDESPKQAIPRNSAH